MRIVVFVWVLAGVSFLGRRSSAQSSDADGQAGLRADLDRIVRVESGSWIVDEPKVAELESTVMESVCRATTDARTGLLAELRREMQEHGAARELFKRDGSMSTDVQDALRLERMALLLGRALERADRDCPFWLKVEPGFVGRQTPRKKWTLGVESGGLVQIRHTPSRWTYGGGGTLRVLPAYGVSDRVSLLGGLEFGGGAMLRLGAEDQRGFVINYFPALPVVVRLHAGTWQYDIEAAAVSLFQADNTRFSYGVRAGFGVGIVALRARSVIPWAGLAIATEHYFPGGGREATQFLRGGLRVGIHWDP